jgi:hypothetical protein
MHEETKRALSLYALAYAATAVVAFRLGDVVPGPTAYVLLSVVYVVPVWLAARRRLDDRLAVALLVTTPFLPALVVVDPLEVGFYGYDPYHTLQTAKAFDTEGPFAVARDRFAWPGFYALVRAVTVVTGLPLETVGKYLPLVVVVAPALFYLFARRLVRHRTAFLAAMGFAGVRTLYTFETKFVDESTAFVLFFGLLLLLAFRATSRASSASTLAGLVAVAAVLTHHYVGALVALVLLLWDLTGVDPSRLDVRRLARTPSRLTAVTGILFAIMVLVVSPGFLGFLGSVADVSPSPAVDVADTPVPSDDATPAGAGSGEGDTTPATTEPSGDGGSPGPLAGIPLRLLQFVATNVVLLTLLSIVVVSGRSWIRSRPGLAVCGAFGSLLAVGYGYSVAFGPVIPLDPSRYLLYMTGALLVPAGYALDRTNVPVDSTTAFSVLVVLLAVTQMVLVPASVMYSSQERTTIGEDHYSPSQFAAGEWVAEYDGDRVVGWEYGHWRASGVDRVAFESAEANCSLLHVWRADAPQSQSDVRDSVVYDNGNVELYYCET